jgi:nitric oxide reductase NorD protein
VCPADGAALCREAERLLPPLIAASGRGEAPPGVVLWGELLPAIRDRGDEGVVDVEDDEHRGERKVIELDRTIRLERRKLGPREDRPLYHVFEKVETTDEYGGETATPDATGDASKTEDAIRELSLGTVVRTPEDPKNLVRANVVMEPTELEVGGTVAVGPRVFTYPEWSYKDGAYREDWCTVVEERYVPGSAGQENRALAREMQRSARRQVDAIRGHLLRALFRRQVRNRQADGPEIDVEAMVERHADLVAGHTPPDRLYLSSRKALREIAILVLVDTSWSTDAWLEGRRVLDLELGSLLVVADAFEGYLEEEVAVASFRSHTRKDVRFGVLKGFADPWHHLRSVAPGLAPDGYTRIGAAMRHATAILDAAKASRKLLLLVSDGKPTDFDRYEGRYGIEDVAQAVREAHQRRIHTFGIAIEKEAKLYLARMLGPGAYRILPRPAMLPDVMADVFLSVLIG